jgi:hypothetical protein
MKRGQAYFTQIDHLGAIAIHKHSSGTSRHYAQKKHGDKQSCEVSLKSPWSFGDEARTRLSD